MCGGTGTPAISRNVGARSTLPTRLWTTRPLLMPGPRTKNGTLVSKSNGKDLPEIGLPSRYYYHIAHRVHLIYVFLSFLRLKGVKKRKGC